MADGRQELESKFWESIENSPFVMLGLKGSGFTRPMTVQTDDDRNIYFFASRSEELVKGLSESRQAVASYSSNGHDFFASMEGELVPDNDRSKIDQLWNPLIAAWYDKGKNDPDLVLLRFDADRADVWDAGTASALKTAWFKLTGRDPAQQMDDSRAEVTI